MRKLAALLLTASTCAWGALAAPREITAEYELRNSGLTIGRVHESFVRSGDTYTIHSVSRSEGILKVVYDEEITLQSTGRMQPGGLQPLKFEERRARDRKRDVDATFDWDRGVMQSRFRGETTVVPLPRDTQDRLSMMYQFMHVKPASGNLVLAMSNGRRIEHYAYRLVDEVRIATPAGDFDTLHFARVTDGPKQSQAEVWLAREHHNFPVRILFVDARGLRVEQTLVALQAR